MTVAALFVDAQGIYPDLLGRTQCWCGDDDYARWPWAPSDDARTYAGPDPVVAHPPCNLWVNMAAVNWKRYGLTRSANWLESPDARRLRPAWYPGGDDGGRFAAALQAVRTYGGVLEHPASTHAWEHYGLPRPEDKHPTPTEIAFGSGNTGWTYACMNPGRWEWDVWVCEIWQSAYGARMRKRTWLLYCGTRPPFELNWDRQPGTHQVGWFDRVKPTVGKREASATPERLARELIRLAEWSRGV